MKHIILSILTLFISTLTFGQNTWKGQVFDRETKLPLANASAFLKGTTTGAKADEKGILSLSNIPDGNQIIMIRLIGYEEQSFNLSFPLSKTEPTLVLLSASDDELEAITISSTRSSRSIQDIPTRVEFIAGEELEEKANMKPGDIRMMLSESTGIQTQQTSATSANSAIRIQGLDGRYTQILKDGFPLYAGAASGLGLLQIAPLDLKQVELIKGSASTLYGGGAIAGLINLISKTPKKERELNFHFDGTDALGLSLNGFYSKRNEKIGTTLFAAYQHNSAYDPANIDLSAIPKSEKFTFNPKLFLYLGSRTNLTIGVNTTFEDRIGGDLHYFKGDADAIHSYFEQNKTQRISTQFSVDHAIDSCGHFTLKSSFSYFNRELTTPGYHFDGTQYSTFTEANYANHGEKLEWIAGVNLWTDKFLEIPTSASALRNYTQTTTGLFLQNTWKTTNWLTIESGIRADYVNDYGFAFLPRISVLFKINKEITSRLGGGLGYKAPTIFTEDSERIQYRDVLPINKKINQLEKSYGANLDVNYKTTILNDEILFNINHLFFFTHLKNPLQLVQIASSKYQFINVVGNVESKGTETNIKMGYKDFKLFLGYTYTDAHQHQNGLKTTNPLTAKHRINTVLMYELEDQWKIGLEAYTFSKQLLNDGSIGKSYVITGFMAEKLWKRFSIYINFENFLDARQTRFDTIYTGTLNNPQFRDIYAPLDGFVINGGIKFRL
jgi:outer membrane receptor for ferrienterochelin and colicins